VSSFIRTLYDEMMEVVGMILILTAAILAIVFVSQLVDLIIGNNGEVVIIVLASIICGVSQGVMK